MTRKHAPSAALDPDALAADLSSLVRERSVTGRERGAVERLAALAAARGLAAAVDEHDLGALRGAEGYPGEEAARTELVGARVTLPGAGPGRLCLNGHLDVVAPGDAPWRHDPFAGVVADGLVHGCGSVDMKAGVVAALHAMAAVRATAGAAPAEVVLQGVLLRGGRRPRHVRRARGRRPLRRRADHGADRASTSSSRTAGR